MEKLFALKTIALQQMVDEYGLDITIAYNEDLVKKNLLIEYYEVETGEGEDYEIETGVYVISCDRERSYSFVLYAAPDFIKPLFIYRLIADAVEFIANCSKETVLSDLEQISTGHTTSDDMGNLADRKRVFKSEKWKFDTAMELIKQKGY
jgi:hypothetical protein